MCADVVSSVDKNLNIDRTDTFMVAQLAEEFGELVHAVNIRATKNKIPEKVVLEDEFADVLFMLCKMAEMFDVDFKKAVESKKAELKARRYL